MEQDILDSLDDIGYKGPLKNDFEKSLELGPLSVAYTKFVADIVTELCLFHSVEEKVNPIPSDNDTEAKTHFLMELNGFLRAYGCPYPQLADVELEKRLADRESCLLLLSYLICEYQAAQIQFTDRPSELPLPTETDTEVTCAAHLKQVLVALGFPKPPASITASQLFTKFEAKVKELTTQYSDRIGEPLLRANLSAKQWDRVIELNDRLCQEYELRRQMLLKRLDVTIQSFLWTDKNKTKQDEAFNAYQPIRRKLKLKSRIEVSDLLAARDSLLIIEKNNTNRRGVETPINKIIIGEVPDRGGRTNTMQAPLPDMPFFKQRQSDPNPQGQRPHSGRGPGGGRGGRVQGGWSGGGGGGDRGGHRGRGGKGGRGSARH